MYAFIIIGLCVLYALAGVALVRKVVGPKVREGHNDVLVPIFLTAGTLYAVLLGFLVIAVWESFDAAKANAADEGSTLTTLYRESVGMPSTEGRELRKELREYTEAVISNEWAIQAKTGGASSAARNDVVYIYRTLGEQPPGIANSAITADFMRTMGTVANDRNVRILQANEGLPAVLWAGIIAGAIIVIGMTFLLYMERRGPHLIGVTLMAFLIGSLLFMVAILDRPFSGPLALSAESFEHAMSVYDSVDSTH